MKKKENKKTTKAGNRPPERNSRAGKSELRRQKSERRRPNQEVGNQLPVTPSDRNVGAGSNQPPIAIGAVTGKSSTVFKMVKPSAIRTIFFAEGGISESQAIRACLMIRIYNN